MRCADYLASFFHQQGVDRAFMVTGGGAMHLNDAFGRHDNYDITFCHHEQACAMAADAYFRISGRPAIVQVTTGPGAINALNGVFGAFVDSVPMIVISGQVRTDTIGRNVVPGLRQMGDQEAPIVEMVKPITKMSHLVSSVDELATVAAEAWRAATTGRPGPVWIDVPIDLQGAQVEVPDIDPSPKIVDETEWDSVNLIADQILDALDQSERPIIIAGNGIRFSQTSDMLRDLGERLSIPISTAWNAHDLIPNSHPSFCGRTGADGDRAGNFSVQNADLIIILGARMAIRQVGFNHQAFGRAAKQIMVDVDPFEMEKPTLRIDHKFLCDLGTLMPMLVSKCDSRKAKSEHKEFADWCRVKVARYPTVLEHHFNKDDEPINPYAFVDALFRLIPEKCNVVTGDGTAAVVTFKAAKIGANHRVFTNKGCASMGFDLPAVIGAAKADQDTALVCIAGDGSLMMNIQELQTIVGLGIPAKIFIFNNNGYHSIRQSQTNYFDGFEVGCGPQSGVTFPDFERVAYGFGIKFIKAQTSADCEKSIELAMSDPGLVICEVNLDMQQLFEPRLSSRKLPNGDLVSSPLEDMSPFLSRSVFEAEMIIPTLSEK